MEADCRVYPSEICNTGTLDVRIILNHEYKYDFRLTGLHSKTYYTFHTMLFTKN